MIFSTKELVKLALCYIILMVSLSKCEIDSSSSITTTTSTTTTTVPEKVLPEEKTLSSTTQQLRELNRAFSILPSEETGKTSVSYSSSSSSFKDVATAAVVFNNGQERRQEQQQGRQQQQADSPYNTNIISGTITPNAVSPILTSSVRHAPLQEVGDSDRDEVVREERKGQQQKQSRFIVMARNEDNNNSDKEGQAGEIGETFSSFFAANRASNYNNNNNNNNNNGAKYYEKMNTGIGSRFPIHNANIARDEFKPETTTTNSMEAGTLIPKFFSSPLSRRQAFSALIGTGDGLISSKLAEESNGREDFEENSPVPTLTWVPAGLSFSCKNKFPGYYSDSSTISKCQVYHMCMTDGRKYTLLCGVGTVFNQLTFVCDHWYNYKCSEADSDSQINVRLWQDFVGEDDDIDKDEDNLQDRNSDNNEGDEAVIERNLVHRSVSLRSPFTITSKFSKNL